jgi:hypothetical protein
VTGLGDELPDPQIWTLSGFGQIAAAQRLPATIKLNWTARSRATESSAVGFSCNSDLSRLRWSEIARNDRETGEACGHGAGTKNK